MGGGASADRKYVLQAVHTVDALASESVESQSRNPPRSRKNTAIYPGAEASQDTFDYNEVKLRPSNRRGSKNGIQIDEDPRKKLPLSRANSKFDPASSKSEHGGTQMITPTASQRGLQTAPSAKNLLILSSIPAPLVAQQSSSRLTRANSMSVSRTNNSSTICSVNYPWLIKSANLQGQSLSDFELGRVIGAL